MFKTLHYQQDTTLSRNHIFQKATHCHPLAEKRLLNTWTSYVFAAFVSHTFHTNMPSVFSFEGTGTPSEKVCNQILLRQSAPKGVVKMTSVAALQETLAYSLTL